MEEATSIANLLNLSKREQTTLSNSVFTKHDAENKNPDTWWSSFADPKKLFPHMEPLVATVVYICIVLAVALLMLLLIWLVVAACQVDKPRRHSVSKRKVHSRSKSPFGSTDCLSSVSSVCDNSSECQFIKRDKCRNCTKPRPQTRLRPLAVQDVCGFCAVKSLAKPNQQTRKSPFLKHKPTEKSILLRSRNQHLSIPQSKGLDHHSSRHLNQEPYFSSCHGCFPRDELTRPHLLPRAKLDESRLLEFIRHQLKADPQDGAIQPNSMTEATRRKSNLAFDNILSSAPGGLSVLPSNSSTPVEGHNHTSSSLDATGLNNLSISTTKLTQ